jgi:DNA-binding transcriptional ArsR family regulator
LALGGRTHLYDVIGHPVRRCMLKLVGERGGVTFTDFISILGISIGSLYYNLDQLEGFIEQDRDKRYVLTRYGKILYRFLLDEEERLASLGLEEVRRAPSMRPLLNVRNHFILLCELPKHFLLPAFILIAFGAWASYESRLFPIIFFYSEKAPLSPGLIPIMFVLSWVTINFMGNVVSAFYGRPLSSAFGLLVGSSYALVPLVAFSSFWLIVKILPINVASIVAQALMLCCALISYALTTVAISVAKGVRMEKAAISTTLLLYISIALAVFLIGF